MIVLVAIAALAVGYGIGAYVWRARVANFLFGIAKSLNLDDSIDGEVLDEQIRKHLLTDRMLRAVGETRP